MRLFEHLRGGGDVLAAIDEAVAEEVEDERLVRRERDRTAQGAARVLPAVRSVERGGVAEPRVPAFGDARVVQHAGVDRRGLGGAIRLDQQVGEAQIRTVMGHFSLCGEGLCIGYDSADPVSSMYTSGFAFTGGTIHKVVFDIADDAYIDVEAHLAAAMARD